MNGRAAIGIPVMYLLSAAWSALAAPPADPPATASPPAPQVCVTVRIGGDRNQYLDCLNAEMAHEVAQQGNRQALLQTVVDQSQPSSPTRQGLYNQTATRERLGSSFGTSVYPQRPTPTYTNPLIH